jgi:hypothetical protein
VSCLDQKSRLNPSLTRYGCAVLYSVNSTGCVANYIILHLLLAINVGQHLLILGEEIRGGHLLNIVFNFFNFFHKISYFFLIISFGNLRCCFIIFLDSRPFFPTRVSTWRTTVTVVPASCPLQAKSSFRSQNVSTRAR